MEYQILAADDEIELLHALELFLEREQIKIIKAQDGAEAIELFEQEAPHLALLDIMMPKKDGFEVLRYIRGKSKIPAIMATAKNQDYDKILGLELGADDYITKPYNPMEVVARIKAQLRRYYDYGSIGGESEEIRGFQLVLKPAEGVLVNNGKQIVLTGTELRILELLMRNPGRIFTKQQIFDYAWDDPYQSDDNTIMVHISNLRAKIEVNPKAPEMLKTVKGLGYKFEKD
ncbi:MAG: response regulator transcription factor [Lachnospiraceae bacterium]